MSVYARYWKARAAESAGGSSPDPRKVYERMQRTTHSSGAFHLLATGGKADQLIMAQPLLDERIARIMGWLGEE